MDIVADVASDIAAMTFEMSTCQVFVFLGGVANILFCILVMNWPYPPKTARHFATIAMVPFSVVLGFYMMGFTLPGDVAITADRPFDKSFGFIIGLINILLCVSVIFRDPPKSARDFTTTAIMPLNLILGVENIMLAALGQSLLSS